MYGGAVCHLLIASHANLSLTDSFGSPGGTYVAELYQLIVGEVQYSRVCSPVFPHVGTSNSATLSGLEPEAASSLPSGEPSSSPVATGLVLSGGLPSIPAELLTRIRKHQYVELSELLPEKIQEACLYGDNKRKKSPPITDFTEWVLAFSTYGQALASQDPSLALKLLVFVGSVARLARDLPGGAWAAYEKAARCKAVANPGFPWEKLDQELWALAAVQCGAARSSGAATKGKRPKSENACYKWNEGTCSFHPCKFSHVCSTCFSPKHKAGVCPSGAPKSKKTAA